MAAAAEEAAINGLLLELRHNLDTCNSCQNSAPQDAQTERAQANAERALLSTLETVKRVRKRRWSQPSLQGLPFSTLAEEAATTAGNADDLAQELPLRRDGDEESVNDHHQSAANETASVQKGDLSAGGQQGASSSMGDIESGGGRSQEKCVIQFSTAVFYCEESEGNFFVDVIRIGPSDTRVSVQYFTENGAAVSGINYVETRGVLTFEPGEIINTIVVPVKPSTIWNPTLDFSIELKLHAAETHWARLTSTHLNRCRCWILHAGTFPSSVVTSSSSRSEMMYEFFRLMMANDFLRQGYTKTLLIDQLPNLHYLLKLVIQVYFVDHVLNVAEQQKQSGGSKSDVLAVYELAVWLTTPIKGLALLFPAHSFSFFLNRCFSPHPPTRKRLLLSDHARCRVLRAHPIDQSPSRVQMLARRRRRSAQVTSGLLAAPVH
jgi:hypothetical protein